MTEKELERLLSAKENAPERKNIALVLSPEITRNAMRLKKRRHDRLQAFVCALAACVFLLLTGGLAYALYVSPEPERILRQAAFVLGGAMGMTLLLSPALIWFSEEGKSEA